jgi:DNA modification methylase
MLSPHLISRLRKIDWDFAGSQSESPFSALHWYPARFASQLPATLIGLLSDPGQVVVDPFAGSGTTLVESQRLCRRSIGIDLNPVACAIAKAKTLPIPASKISCIAQALRQDAISRVADLRSDAVTAPPTVQTKWYTATVRRNLGQLWDLVHAYRGSQRALAQAAFSAVLLPVCRETRHWGYVCDNSSPIDNHAGDVLGRYCEVLDKLAAAYQERDAEIVARRGSLDQIERSNVICGDARKELDRLDPCSVDLVVTSPPYFGVSDYIKAQRLSMEWFEYDIEPLRQNEIGARSKRHRLTAVADYTTEIVQVFDGVRRCLKPDAACVVIIGESATRESVHGAILTTLQKVGLKLRLDLNRRVSSQRRQAPSIVGEHILLLSNS